MSDIDHAPAGPRPSGPGTDRRPGSGFDIRVREASVAPMDGGSGGSRMISEAVADTRPWIAVEHVV